MTQEIWAISDGRAGLRNQVLGLAEAIARIAPCKVVEKTFALRQPWARLPPQFLPAPFKHATPESTTFAPPWPRVLIGCGRAGIAASLAIKRLSGGATFTVQTQDPRVNAAKFDLVVPPIHDALTGTNVFPIHGSPNRITDDVLAEAREKFAARFASLPHPRVGVLIGGKAKAFNLTADATNQLTDDLIALMEKTGAGLMLTTSRRTGEENTALIKQRLSGHPAALWDGEGENPYFGILALADYILVTEDSINMAAEAAATGKPVYILPMQGGAPKFSRFHQALEALGAARPYAGVLEPFTYQPLRETARVAAEICSRAGLTA